LQYNWYGRIALGGLKDRENKDDVWSRSLHMSDVLCPFQYDDRCIFIHTFFQFVVALLHLEGSLLKLLSVSEMLAEK
jgi:hypothetical protein